MSMYVSLPQRRPKRRRVPYDDSFVSYSNTFADRKPSNMAVQWRLGLLPKRRFRADFFDRSFAGAVSALSGQSGAEWEPFPLTYLGKRWSVL